MKWIWRNIITSYLGRTDLEKRHHLVLPRITDANNQPSPFSGLTIAVQFFLLHRVPIPRPFRWESTKSLHIWPR
jgi:hypothetical protein